jgi:glycosyltransferase involved in cell wall biosynthesis
MRTANGPLISVLVCTYNRLHLLPRALASVLRQDCPDYEVLVVDDGSTPPVEAPGPAGGRVRLVRTEHRGVGAARAAGLRAARGEFIAYCDDDDEWLPNHLSALLAYLRDHPGVALVYADSEWHQPGAPPGLPYSFDHEGTLLREMNYIFPTDVLHRAGAARAVGGFDSSLEAYEDWDLWLRMSRTFTLRHLPVVLGRHHWHEGCVTAANPWQIWDRVYWYARDALPTASVADRHDLVPDAAKARPFDRSTWRDGRRELIWRSVMRAGEGYGTVGRQLLLTLEHLGVDIIMAPTRDQPVRGFERFYKPLDHWGKLAFYCDYRLRPGVLPCERVVSHSMWESTLVPPEHVAEVNRSAALQYVPCRQNADAYRACGLRVPIKVLHYGVDPQEFPYLERPAREVFTFGSFGDFSPRKGIDVLVRAFEQEFAPGEPVRLVLKTAGRSPDYEIRDERVCLRSGYLDRQQLLEFLRGLDAFVLPSRGEGFGLCGLEAMATGLPLIATNWSGPAEYLDPLDSFPLNYRLVDVQSTEATRIRYFGQWAEPDLEHLRHLLRWLYEHPREAAERGQRAADRVHERWTWERIGRQVCQDLDAVAGE